MESREARRALLLKPFKRMCRSVLRHALLQAKDRLTGWNLGCVTEESQFRTALSWPQVVCKIRVRASALRSQFITSR